MLGVPFPLIYEWLAKSLVLQQSDQITVYYQ